MSSISALLATKGIGPSGGGSAVAETKAAAAALSYKPVSSGGPSFLLVNGYLVAGDLPRIARYKRQSTTPAASRPFPASGFFQSGDGDYWVIQPQNNELWVEEFGAKGRDQNDRTDQWQSFEDCLYAILMQPDTSNIMGGTTSEGGTDMRIGRGIFYKSKSTSITGGAIHVKGSGYHNGGTQIRTPINVDAWQTQDTFGSYATFGHEGGTINNFPRKLGSLCYVPGQTHVYVSTNTGTPNPLAWPSGTGPGTITSGSATFLYVRELTWAEQIQSGASYSKISDLVCWAVGDVYTEGWDEDQTAIDGGYHCGILIRARTSVENVYCLSYAGHGLCVSGDGGTDCRGGGIPNNSLVRNYRGYFNGHAGLKFEGSDANACAAEMIDTGFNKRAGIEEATQLGNRYFQVQSAFDGSPGNVTPGFGTSSSQIPRYGACTHNGYHYTAIAPLYGSFVTPDYTIEPGTAGSETSWILTDGDSHAVGGDNWPTWSTSLFFWPAGGFISFSLVSENQILGLYIEGGGYGPQLGIYDMAWGGALGNRFSAQRGANMYSRAQWLNQMNVYTEFPFADGLRSMAAFLGGKAVNASKPSEAVDNTVWGYQDFEGYKVRLHFEAPGGPRAYANADVYLRDDASPNFIMGWTGNNTTRTFGQSVVQREMAYFPRLVLGSGGIDMSDPAAMVFQTTNSNLGTGSGDATGDRAGRIYFYANDPAPGDPWGWQVRHVSGNLRFIPLYP